MTVESMQKQQGDAEPTFFHGIYRLSHSLEFYLVQTVQFFCTPNFSRWNDLVPLQVLYTLFRDPNHDRIPLHLPVFWLEEEFCNFVPKHALMCLLSYLRVNSGCHLSFFEIKIDKVDENGQN